MTPPIGSGLTRRQFVVISATVGIAAAEYLTSVTQPWSADASTRATSSDGQEIWADLLEGNRRLVAGTGGEPPTGGQPRAIVLGCSDSAVTPSTVFDKALGDLHVIRAPGALADQAALRLVEEAVQQLGTGLLVVLGHDTCGVSATLSASAVVQHSARALLEDSVIIRRAVSTGRILIVKALYRLATGEVVKLG
jgi:carbonic anhydrase